ncbi:MAG: hypothetical protein GF350_08430, partial [Chitinivibrionales bacterium]|nr:hypothetical protein [Chitinivibrionales bacterium]
MTFLKPSLFLCLFFGAGIYAEASLSAVSWLGGGGDNDRVVGTAVLPDGAIVLAANIGDAQPGGVQSVLLNSAKEASGGALVVLSGDGTSVESVVRIADELLDMACDSEGNMYLAAAAQGIIKYDPAATEVVWTKACGGYCRRIDAGTDGTVAGLNNTGDNSGRTYVYDTDGAGLGDFGGLHRTQDVAVCSDLQYVYQTGFANKGSGCNPVQVAYLRALTYDGTQQWNNYDWPGTQLDNCDGDGYVNNMADTRGYRVSIGADGKLYCAFESAGGNHIFRYHPRDDLLLKNKVSIVGGDFWHNWYNTKSEHKTFFARFDPATGDYLRGQQFCTRYCAQADNCKCGGNAVRVKEGDIMADSEGRVYLAGASASGLPIPDYSDCKDFTVPDGGAAYNPFDVNTYSGGAFILIMSADFSKRLY